VKSPSLAIKKMNCPPVEIAAVEGKAILAPATAVQAPWPPSTGSKSRRCGNKREFPGGTHNPRGHEDGLADENLHCHGYVPDLIRLLESFVISRTQTVRHELCPSDLFSSFSCMFLRLTSSPAVSDARLPEHPIRRFMFFSNKPGLCL
jgi:hypothetical protein